MNTTTNSPDHRPIGYWLRVVDRKLDDAMRELFAEEGITRRDWRRLNVIAGKVDDPRLRAKLAAHPERLAPLVERGWVTDEPAPRLTEEGESSYAALLERVTALRARVAGSVTPDDFQTTLATLEAIARELGWHDGERMPRPHRESRPGRRHGCEHGHREHGHGEHGHGHREHGHGHREHGHGGHRGARGHRDDRHLHVHVHLDGAPTHGHPGAFPHSGR
ncbi:MarR family winged helix-turn-helix transcriptional regulator [Agromyces sp. NPDC058136]|uniref:MarR family winged helix-turn-helix transcriptional regulator n=1 Tax=Agromyces sp. NPDC058136 TaxID=3346354 RepID=UPI0036DC0418